VGAQGHELQDAPVQLRRPVEVAVPGGPYEVTNNFGATFAKAQMEPSAPARMAGRIRSSHPESTVKSGLSALTCCLLALCQVRILPSWGLLCRSVIVWF
jgi:hypothetical protein